MDTTQELQARIDDLERRFNFLTLELFNIEGLIKTVTAIPTGAPTKLINQIVMYFDSLTAPTVKRLYIYSKDTKAWYYIALT